MATSLKTRAKNIATAVKNKTQNIFAKTKEYTTNAVTAAYDDGRALPTYGVAGVIGGGVFAAAFVGISALTIGLTVVVSPFVAPVALAAVGFTLCFNSGYLLSLGKEIATVSKKVMGFVAGKTKPVFNKAKNGLKNVATKVVAKVKSFSLKKKKEATVETKMPVHETVAEEVKPLDTEKTAKDGFDQATTKDVKTEDVKAETSAPAQKGDAPKTSK